MRKVKKIVMSSTLLLLMMGQGGYANTDSTLLMIGVNEAGEEVEVLVPKEKYKKNLSEAVSLIATSALPVLTKHKSKNKKWVLRTAVFGLGVNAEIGIGSAKFAALPRIRVGFSNAKEPSVP